jgi:hypothetical protein
MPFRTHRPIQLRYFEGVLPIEFQAINAESFSGSGERANLNIGFYYNPHFTLWFLGGVAGVLLIWAVLRSFTAFDKITDDSASWLLLLARSLIVGCVILVFLDLQPLAIKLFMLRGLGLQGRFPTRSGS